MEEQSIRPGLAPAAFAGRRMKIFTWHIHGTYLYYLSQGNFDLYIPVQEGKEEGYCGRGSTFPFGKNVIEVPAAAVKDMTFDGILFQSKKNYLVDQFELLSEEQRKLPKIYLEHDPPREIPTETRHVTAGADILLVHVTHFNKLMWDNGETPVKVIEHGVLPAEAAYSGKLERGIVVINNIQKRGRRLGLDLFLELRKTIPLDIIGMGTEDIGLGEIAYNLLPEFISRYRFFFSPIRYTSLGLSILEAMMVGMPVVGLATTELPSVLQNNISGFIHTDVSYLTEKMALLLDNHTLSKKIGKEGQEIARNRFNIHRFTRDWENTFHAAIAGTRHHETAERIYG